MSILLHITRCQQWEQAKLSQVYRSETLDSEGFIHCSTPQQVIKVANTFFAGQTGLILLCIDSEKVKPTIKYEEADGDCFPHIYGELNVDAIFKAFNFEPDEKGKFEFPVELD